MAQLDIFQPVPVPTAPASLYIGPGYYYSGAEVFVRHGQQGLVFDLGLDFTQFLKVRVQGQNGQWGAWTVLHAGSPLHTIVWSASQIASLGAPRLYPAEVEYGSNGATYAFNLVVVPPAQRAFVCNEYNVPRYPDGVPVTIQHTILVWSGPQGSTGNAALDRPILVVEGVDAENENGPEAYYALGATPEAPLFPRAQAQGADIAILNFGDGGRRMQPNAAVVRRAIEILRQYSTDRSRNLDVVGVSMGGVVTRYALAQMEQEGWLYGVDRFVSMDAPQQGAVIDAALQSDIRNRQAPEDWPVSLNRPAGRQLLKVNAFDTASPTEHQSFYAELRALNGGVGYPTRTTNVGVSLGTPSPNPTPGARWGRLDINICWPGNPHLPPFPDCSDRDFFVTGDIAQAGSPLPEKVTRIWGRRWLARYELLRYPDVNPTFIPYASALDIVGGVSRFDAPTLAVPAWQLPSFHDRLPAVLVDPLLRRLGYDLPAPPSVAISGPTSLASSATGRWRASTPDPGAGYQYNWQYRIRFPNGCGGGGGGILLPMGLPAGQSLPGGETEPNALPCGVWHDGDGSGAVFVRSVSGSMWYDLRVRASNATGASVWSATHSVCVGACNGIVGPGEGDDASLSSKAGESEWETAIASVYPNPLRVGDSGAVAFTMGKGGQATLRVFDALGREVDVLVSRSLDAGAHMVPLPSELPAGSYVVRLEGGGQVVSRLVTILR